MKTYSESLNTVLLQCATEEELRNRVLQHQEMIERFVELIAEVKESEDTRKLLLFQIEGNRLSSNDIYNLAMSVFVNGLLIGCIMERRELDEP